MGHRGYKRAPGLRPGLGSGFSWPWRPQTGSIKQTSGVWRLGRICPHPFSPLCSLLDPSLVAFLRSHSRTCEQAEEKATGEQRPGGRSAEVTGEEPIMPTSASEPRQEDKLEPGAPGLEEEGTSGE